MQVSVIRMPRRENAATARRSSSSTQPGCFKTEAFAKSVPRGSMIVGHAHRGAFVGKRLHPLDARFAEALGVGHDVRLRHRHEVRGAEEIADPDLVLDRAPHRVPELARLHGALHVVQSHLIPWMEEVSGTLPRRRSTNS